LVQPSDRQAVVDGFAGAMVRLATSPVERAAMGRAGRSKVERSYDWDAKAECILGVYRRVLQGSSAVRGSQTHADASADPF
jgi:glycosyltransferase involved in cell wall biosynthesis